MLSIATLVLSSFAGPTPLTATFVQEPEQDVQAREAAFAELLTASKLVGFFTQDDAPEAGLIQDSYTIKRVSKQEDGRWLFEAVIEYSGKDIPFAMALPVLWAGDTPVISLSDFAVPLVGTFSARILFDGNQYAGTWRGADHGGHMFGVVERSAGETNGAPAPAPGGSAEGGSDGETGVHWPSFRGEGGRGVADGFSTPTEWDIEEGTHVAWRVPLPGLAHSSPVIWGERMFLTTAVRQEGEQQLKVGRYGDIMPVTDEGVHSFEVHCLDKNTGETLWSQVAWEGEPAVMRHPKGSHAASSPATDGKRVVAFFGTEGLYCYDMDGALQWKKEFGLLDSGYYVVPDAQWGFSASPVLHDDVVIIQCDVQENSFIAALRASDGEEIWRTERDEVPTWSTPTVDVREGRAQVICNGYKHIGGYDLDTGEELWKLVGGGDIPVPTPIVDGDLIFITNAHGQMAPIYAIEADASGTLEMDGNGLRWNESRRGNYMQTPIAYEGELYCCNDAGILSCYGAQRGFEIYRERLGEGRTGFTSSGVAADGKLYFASEEGDVYVVRAGREFEVLATNSLGEECMASPAVSEGVLYYRTRGHVVALSE